MSMYDRERALRQIRNKKVSGTTRWIVGEPQFQRWLNSSNGALLLLNGISKSPRTHEFSIATLINTVGSGKTLCMSVIWSF